MICTKCGFPKELCVCGEVTKESQRIRVYSTKRRYGKIVTLVEGFEDVDVQTIAKDLKRELACGGTAKGNVIELQGDHKSRVRNVLANAGFSKEMIDVV